MSLSAKERAYRRLESNRSGGLNYEPRSVGSTHAAFSNSPILYYTVYDSNLAQVRKEVVYAHSLEELHYMAIDNASRLETLDMLFRIRHDFNSRTMTVRDLILTAFVGTSDGKVNTMLVCPYQGDTPYDPDTTLYAVVMSELLPNTRQTPLRIALNVPATMKKWSHMSKLRMFGGSVDSKLIELNNRVNCSQIVELRNDPEGSTRYSQRVLDEIERAKNPPKPAPQPVVPEATAVSDGVEAGTVLDATPADETTATPPIEASEGVTSEPTEVVEADIVVVDVVTEPAIGETTATKTAEEEELDSQRAPIAVVTDEPPVIDSQIDVSKISGPLQAARLEDNTKVEVDDIAVEAAESNPVFSELETGATKSASTHPATSGAATTSAEPESVVESEEAAPALQREVPAPSV